MILEIWKGRGLETKVEVSEGSFGGVDVVSVLEHPTRSWGSYRNGLVRGRVLTRLLVVVEDCRRPW